MTISSMRIAPFPFLTLARFVVAVGTGLLALGAAPVHGAATISIVDNLSNCADFELGGTVGNRTLNCVPLAPAPPPPPGAPTGCTLTAAPTGLTGPGAVILTAACSGGGAATSYAWTGGVGPTTTVNTVVTNISATTTFTVTPSNASGSGNTASTIVTVSTTAPPPSGGAVSCTAQGFTTTQFYNWDWSQSGLSIYTDVSSTNVRNPQGPIGPNGIVVIAFTPTGTAFGATGSVTIAPYPGDLHGTTRTMSISTTPCDFAQPFPWTRTGYDVGTQFTVGSYIPDVYPPLVAGTRYYLNITSRDAAGNSTCGSSGRACDMVIKANKP